MVNLSYSEFERPFIYYVDIQLANGGGGACIFNTRTEAIRYAKSSIRMYSGIDPDRNLPDRGNYPFENFRDDLKLDPTYIFKWDASKAKFGTIAAAGGIVTVKKWEVCGLFNWSAYPYDKVTPEGQEAYETENAYFGKQLLKKLKRLYR